LPRLRSALPPLFGSTSEFVSTSKARDPIEILDEHEVVYRIHWELRDAEIRGRVSPNGCNREIVQERHYALSWLINCDLAWDDVTTDT
jgi:hypothetical protein